MKKIALPLIALFISGFTQLQAQSTQSQDLAIIQNIFGKQKKEVIASYMKITDQTVATKFWAVYDEYEKERQGLVQERIANLNDFAIKYSSFDNESAKALFDQILSNDTKLAKLQKKYFDKMSSSVGGYQAAKFFQIERYIENLVHAKVQENIPFIGDIEKDIK